MVVVIALTSLVPVTTEGGLLSFHYVLPSPAVEVARIAKSWPLTAAPPRDAQENGRASHPMSQFSGHTPSTIPMRRTGRCDRSF
jgi:hypothetical protein